MIRYIILLTLALALNSCSSGIEEKSIFSISEDLTLSLSQGFDRNGSHPVIKIQTQEESTCSNAEFTYEFALKDEVYDLDIKDIIEPEVCNNIQDIISTSVPLHLPEGRSVLNLIIKSSVASIGVINLKENSYELVFDNAKGFVLTATNINKIGPNAIWGKISFDENIELHSKTIAERLSAIQDENLTPIEGAYGLFNYFGGNTVFADQKPNDFAFFIYYNDWEETASSLNMLLEDLNETSYDITNSYGVKL